MCKYSHYVLHVGEHKATVKVYMGQDRDSYLDLMRIPTKPAYDYYSFESIIEGGKQENETACNILGVVRQVYVLLSWFPANQIYRYSAIILMNIKKI